MEKVDIAIVGAGVIGLSIAYALSKKGYDIVVLEKNESFGQETSSRNSEVIHAGLYYPPGSLKATTCIEGKRLLYDFCDKAGVAYKKLGKLVVASNKDEFQKIETIYANAASCGIDNLQFLTASEIKDQEPSLNAGGGFFSPDSGIVDSHGFMQALFTRAKQQGVTFSFSTEALDINKDAPGYVIDVSEPGGEKFCFHSGIVINAAGLYSDKVAAMVGIDVERWGYKINFCKGQYFRIRNSSRFKIKHLIYPPPTSISLGIHITPDLGEGLRLGPDAHYVSVIDYAIDENALETFCDSVRAIVPDIKEEDLLADIAGIRPKLQKEEESFRDFVVSEESDKGFAGFINLIGIESPGLTACLSIANLVSSFV
jgi:L-2-hydroxyglutarate oxidase LhgO